MSEAGDGVNRVSERGAREALEIARVRRNLSMRSLAHLMGMEGSNAYRMLRGTKGQMEKDARLHTDTVARLCTAMSVGLAYRPGEGWSPIMDWVAKADWEGPQPPERPTSYFESLEMRIAKLEQER